MRAVGRQQSRSAPAGGTMGGPAVAAGPRPGKRYMIMGDEVYLWILVAVELAVIGFFRSAFSRYHGG